MGNSLQIFEHEHFGKIRVVMIDEEPNFVGKDVATALGYSNSRDALSKHVPDKFKRVIKAKELEQMASQSKGRDSRLLECDSPRGLTFINEAGLYKLILRSKLPAAEDFSDWVCSEVLPSIRKTGKYSIVAKPEHIPNPRRREAQLRDASVYVALMSNGTVKIGQSSHVKKRLAQIESQYKLGVVKKFYTPAMSREVARAIERACHKIFSSSKFDGEFFSVKFEEACTAVDSFVEYTKSLPLAPKHHIVTTKLIADKKSE